MENIIQFMNNIIIGFIIGLTVSISISCIFYILCLFCDFIRMVFRNEYR